MAAALIACFPPHPCFPEAFRSGMHHAAQAKVWGGLLPGGSISGPCLAGPGAWV
jgi:hypothetical protein